MGFCTATKRTVIEIPAYLTRFDLKTVADKTLRQMEPGHKEFLLDMRNVRNVFNSTALLIKRVYDRAVRLQADIYIVNASEPVRNALRALEIDTYMPVYETSREVCRMPEEAKKVA